MAAEICLGNVMIDCGDEDALCGFYAALLGWEKYDGLPAVRSKTGVVFLFKREEDYMPPVWPEQAGRQQKQMHLDFQVKDLPAAVSRARALGAVQVPQQYGGSHFVTMIDPAGHPFCLCLQD